MGMGGILSKRVSKKKKMSQIVYSPSSNLMAYNGPSGSCCGQGQALLGCGPAGCNNGGSYGGYGSSNSMMLGSYVPSQYYNSQCNMMQGGGACSQPCPQKCCPPNSALLSSINVKCDDFNKWYMDPCHVNFGACKIPCEKNYCGGTLANCCNPCGTKSSYGGMSYGVYGIQGAYGGLACGQSCNPCGSYDYCNQNWTAYDYCNPCNNQAYDYCNPCGTGGSCNPCGNSCGPYGSQMSPQVWY